MRRSSNEGHASCCDSGDVVTEAVKTAIEVNAEAIFMSDDVSAYAHARRQRLEDACAEHRMALHLFPGITIAAAGDVTTSSSTHFSVFTPFHRAWRQVPRRPVEPPPRRLALPSNVRPGRLPGVEKLALGRRSPVLPAGGETAARRRLSAWLRSGLGRYRQHHDDLAADATSRLSPYLHFGCLSPLEVAERAGDLPGGGSFVRQLAWRDFYHQLLDARPETSHDDMRPRGDRWLRDEAGLEAWKEGRTGYPIVDAGMRQLLQEGFIHNRARMITASFLTKDLYVDWREGAAHYLDWLVDGDVANNSGNWQWVAGTGADTRPNRVFNPIRQAKRFDPRGDYVRRYLPELAEIGDRAVHEPWRLERAQRARIDYPEPIVDHAEATARFRSRRALADSLITTSIPMSSGTPVCL